MSEHNSYCRAQYRGLVTQVGALVWWNVGHIQMVGLAWQFSGLPYPSTELGPVVYGEGLGCWAPKVGWTA
ncbi:hypothetical protein MTR67_021290 [Solanum verrucosum]|uniref:Uncharacterized protein n=1 Tax=Solanum verrucosum TaxID=315347 RepID=A0AAF0QSM0_SOLVR|nr:hypothetical protein MTR67_021290 [Solanum verrucosum]